MPEFSRRNIVTHLFNVDKEERAYRIGYDMIIGHELMLQLNLKENFGRQILEWDEIVVLIKYSINFPGKPSLIQ